MRMMLGVVWWFVIGMLMVVGLVMLLVRFDMILIVRLVLCSVLIFLLLWLKMKGLLFLSCMMWWFVWVLWIISVWMNCWFVEM